MPHFPWEQYGIAGLVIAVLFFILWRILVWVMKWVDKQAEQHAAEREQWLKRIEALDKSIELHHQGSIEARKAAEEAHRFQREEHIKFAEQLSAQSATQSENLNNVCRNLVQVEQALGRINGYTKEQH